MTHLLRVVPPAKYSWATCLLNVTTPLHVPDEGLEHLGELVLGHEAREIDLHAPMIEENLAANGG
jgi:hypothetical protein